MDSNVCTWLREGKGLSPTKIADLTAWVELVEQGDIIAEPKAKPAPKPAKTPEENLEAVRAIRARSIQELEPQDITPADIKPKDTPAGTLSPRQARILKEDCLIEMLLTCSTQRDAAIAAGVNERSLYRYLKDPIFLARYEKAKDKRMLDRAWSRPPLETGPATAPAPKPEEQAMEAALKVVAAELDALVPYHATLTNLLETILAKGCAEAGIIFPPGYKATVKLTKTP